MTAAMPLDPLALLGAATLRAEIASGDALDVRAFEISEALSAPFQVRLLVVSRAADIDLAAVLGQDASFTIERPSLAGASRAWTGVCVHMQQTGVEDSSEGLSTYELTIVPRLWLLSQRRNHRMFQRKSEPEIVRLLLDEWGIEHELRIDEGTYKAREYRVQYAESDYAFICRMLEDAGITYTFDTTTAPTKLVLDDQPHAATPRAPLPYVNSANPKLRQELVTNVRLERRTRPGKYVQRDWDFRPPPDLALTSESTGGLPTETKLERFHYVPNALHFIEGPGQGYPVGDDRGKFRRDLVEGDRQAQLRLEAKQASARSISLATTAFDVRPGVVLVIKDHPRPDVTDQPLLVVGTSYSGDAVGEWAQACEVRYASAPHRPPVQTPKPRVMGMEPATVVGPAGEEIHVDEFGRVKVHFHWDRESTHDENSSVWIPVSHPWAGKGYGHINHPRVGHEVLINFLCGDPDQPIVVGRLYTAQNPVIYPLPQNKTKSGWRSQSTPGGGGFNEIMFDDKKGEELVRVQAERDFTALVKNDSGVVILRDSMSHVGRDETHSVLRDQTIRVKRDRKLRVENVQSHWVDREIFQQSLEATTVNRSKQVIWHHSNEEILLTVAPEKRLPNGSVIEAPIKSFIKIEKDKITIQAPKVEINPGVKPPPLPPKPPPISRAEERYTYFFGAP